MIQNSLVPHTAANPFGHFVSTTPVRENDLLRIDFPNPGCPNGEVVSLYAKLQDASCYVALTGMWDPVSDIAEQKKPVITPRRYDHPTADSLVHPFYQIKDGSAPHIMEGLENVSAGMTLDDLLILLF